MHVVRGDIINSEEKWCSVIASLKNLESPHCMIHYGGFGTITLTKPPPPHKVHWIPSTSVHPLLSHRRSWPNALIGNPP